MRRLLLAAGLATAAPRMHADPPALRFGISQKLLVGVNLSDARAAFVLWSHEILASIGFHLVNQEFILPSERLQSGLRAGTLDFVVLTIPEFRKVRAYVDTSQIISDQSGGEELLLLVKDAGPMKTLTDLRDRTLLIHDHAWTNMASEWLTVSLARESLPDPESLFRQITRSPKLSQVVLPVFFGQADACITSRRSFATMTELNPQLSKQLRPLAVSPRLVAALVACRKDYPAALRQKLVGRILDLRSDASTRQMLTLFQSATYKSWGEDLIQPTLALLDTYDKQQASKGVRP